MISCAHTHLRTHLFVPGFTHACCSSRIYVNLVATFSRRLVLRCSLLSQLSQNPVVRVDDDVLAPLARLAVLPSGFVPFPISSVDIMVVADEDPFAAPFGGRVVTSSPIGMETWPRDCVWTGPNVSSITW